LRDLDLTFSPAALEDYQALVDRSEAFDIDGTRVRVAALRDVIRSKEAAGQRATPPFRSSTRSRKRSHEAKAAADSRAGTLTY